MANSDTTITFGIRADETGAKTITNLIRDIDKGVGALGPRFEALSRASAGWGAAFRNALAFTAVAGALRAFSEIPMSMDSIVERGNRFNATMKNAKAALAGLMAEARPGEFRTVAAAAGAAGAAIDLLRVRARAAGVSQVELVGVFQHVTGALSRANVSVERQADIVANATKAFRAYGMSAGDIAGSILGLMNGRAGKNRIADYLGLSSEEIKSLREGGKLVGELENRIGKIAGGVSGDSVESRKVRLNDALDEASGAVAAAAMEKISQGYLSVAKAIESIPVETLKKIGDEFGELVNLGMSIVEFGVQNAAAIFQLMKWGGIATGLFTATKGMSSLVAMTKNLGTAAMKQMGLVTATTAAVDAETAALGRNTAAQIANGKARGMGRGGRAASATAGLAPEILAEVAAAKRGVAEARQENVRFANSVMTRVGGTENTARAIGAQAAARQASSSAMLATARAGAAAKVGTLAAGVGAPVAGNLIAGGANGAGATVGAGIVGGAAAIGAIVVAALAAFAAAGYMGYKWYAQAVKNKEEEAARGQLAASAATAGSDEIFKKNREATTREELTARANATQAALDALNARRAAADGEDARPEAQRAMSDLQEKMKVEILQLRFNQKEFLRQNQAARDSEEKDEIRGRVANFTEKDYQELEKIRETEKSVFERLDKAVAETIAAQKMRDGAAATAAEPTDDADLRALRKKESDVAELRLAKAKKAELELEEKSWQAVEKRRRVDADLAILRKEAAGASAVELRQEHELETTRRRIFDIEREMVAMGMKKNEAAAKAVEIAQAEQGYREKIQSRKTAEGLGDMYADLLVRDAALKGANDGQVAALREQAEIMTRINSLKQQGLTVTQAETLAVKEAQIKRQEEAKTRGRNLADYEIQASVKHLRANGKKDEADKLEAIAETKKRMDALKKDSPEMEDSEAFARVRNEMKNEAIIKNDGVGAKLAARKKGSKGAVTLAAPAIPDVSFADIVGGAGSYYGGINKFYEAHGAGAIKGAAERGTDERGAQGALFNRVNEGLSNGAGDIVAAVGSLAETVTASLGAIRARVADAEAQIANSRN